MRSLKIFLLVFMFLPFSALTQKNKKEEIQAKRVEFITRKLDLSVEEAQKFWPLQNELDAKKKALRKEKKALKPSKSIDEMTDAEVSSLLDKSLSLKQKEVDLEKEYNEKFKKALPVKKVAKLQQAEKQFKEELLKKLRASKQQARPGQARPNQGRGGQRPGPRSGADKSKISKLAV